jgi:hypothetical protein
VHEQAKATAKPQRVVMAAAGLNSSLRRVDASSWSATGSGVTILADAACSMVLCGCLVGPHSWGTTRPRLRDASKDRRRGLRVLSGESAISRLHRLPDVMKATRSRSKSPIQDDVGSPHRSHGWRNEKRS